MRKPLRPSDEGWGEMEVMVGATPKGLEETGVGETPLLEMVLPGVTAIPGTGEEPVTRKEKRTSQFKNHIVFEKGVHLM